MNKASVKNPKLCMVIGIAGFLLATSTGFATPLTIPVGGAQANILGCVFINSSGLVFSNCSGTNNVFNPGGPDTGSYAGLTGGTIDTLGPQAPGPLSVVDFATFGAVPAGTINFDLTQIDPGIGTAGTACTTNTVGNVCTPAGSAFTLTQTASGVSISLSLTGIAYLGSSSTGSSPTLITFSVPNPSPGTITGVLADIDSSVGISDTFAATVASVAPEPGTIMMSWIGLGMLAGGLIRRRLHGK